MVKTEWLEKRAEEEAFGEFLHEVMEFENMDEQYCICVQNFVLEYKNWCMLNRQKFMELWAKVPGMLNAQEKTQLRYLLKNHNLWIRAEKGIYGIRKRK